MEGLTLFGYIGVFAKRPGSWNIKRLLLLKIRPLRLRNLAKMQKSGLTEIIYF